MLSVVRLRRQTKNQNSNHRSWWSSSSRLNATWQSQTLTSRNDFIDDPASSLPGIESKFPPSSLLPEAMSRRRTETCHRMDLGFRTWKPLPLIKILTHRIPSARPGKNGSSWSLRQQPVSSSPSVQTSTSPPLTLYHETMASPRQW